MDKRQVLSWIDVHTHLNFLSISPEEAIQRAQANGVERFVTIGTSPEDHELVFSLAQNLGPQVYCTLGVHPHEAELYTPEVDEAIRMKSKDPKVLAIGEIGLDYFYEQAPREIQREAFRSQLQLALEMDLPVEIHSREAEQDTVEILKEFGAKIRGLIHCFTGSRWLAEECLKLGMDISFSGVLSFKNADDLREVCRVVPLDRLHVETDAPFLAPVPKRGKKNEPAFMVHTAQEVANLKQVTMEELSRQTKLNALRVFPKLDWP